jgi:hypothetical protein
MMPQRIAFAHERKVLGTLLLNLLFSMFEHNEAHLKRHFGASLETMTVGISVLLAQLASRPTSVVRLARCPRGSQPLPIRSRRSGSPVRHHDALQTIRRKISPFTSHHL